VVLGLALAGCSSEPDQPATLPDDRPSATSTSATPSAMTPEQEVEAAVRAYYAELTRAAQTNDTESLRKMTTTGCPCFRPVKVIERNEANGRRTPDASFQVERLMIHEVDATSAAVEVETDEAAYQVVNREAEVVGRVPARSNHVQLSLVRNHLGAWIVANEFVIEGSR
jgi:hypothetical protein